MNLSKLNLVKIGGIAGFILVVAFLIAMFSGNVHIAINPETANADGAGASKGETFSNEPTFGASSAPSLVNGCLELNGTTECFYGSAWAQAASTSCSFKLPGATTTLQFAAAQVRNQQGTANYGEWGWSYGIMATSTSLGGGAISATLNTVIVASSTGNSPNNVNPVYVLPPGGYLTFKQGSTTNTQVGRCSAQVQTI